MFSYQERWVVRPLIIYSESVIIFKGINWGMGCIVAMAATISLVWFVWCFPRVCIALFLRSLWLNHTPPLHCAFFLPLLKQASSMWTCTFSYLQLGPSVACLYAGFLESCSESVKTWKHLARFFLLMIVGLKRIFPLFCFTVLFWSFLFGVSNRFP